MRPAPFSMEAPTFEKVEDERRHRKRHLAAAFRVFGRFGFDEVVAAAHAHSVHGKAWSALRRPLDPLTQDACALDEAAWWFVTMERTCHSQLLTEAAGAAVPIAPDLARETARHVGPPTAGWRALQLLYHWIVGVEPDLLED